MRIAMEPIGDALEHRTWSFERRFRALAFTFGVRSDLPDVGRFLERLLAPFLVAGPNGSGFDDALTYTLTHRLSPGADMERTVNRYELFQNATSIQRVAHPGSMVDWVILDSTRRAVQAAERF